MAKNQNKDAAQEALRLIKEEAEIRARMNSSYDEYIKAVKEAHALQKTLNKNIEIQNDVQAKINKLKASLNNLSGQALIDAQKELAVEEEKFDILKKQNELMGKQVELYKTAAKEANKMSLALGKAGKAGLGLAKSISNLPSLVENGLGKLKGLGLFELDKAMKQSALSMGVLSKEGVGFRQNIKSAQDLTVMIGGNIKELSKIQSSYSEGLGRNVVLTKQGLKGLYEMSVVTGLGAEGTAQMANDMELQGYSAERTAEFTEQTLNASHKMGLNATKVMKNLASGFKLMDKYRFKEGAKGLEKMAKLVTKLGVDMNAVTGMADKLWNIEGAVEMSAQLNVMGGAWAQLSDPFHLMYMARNDMAGLTEEIANASKESVSFNKATGEFDMSAEGMHRLKIIAEQTGMAYEDLVTMGKNAAKLDKIKGQIGFTIGGSKEDKEMMDYISNKSQINKDGKAQIMINGTPKLLSQLSQADKDVIKAQMDQQQTMKEIAEQARSFDEQFSYAIDNLKFALLPLIESFNKPGGLGEQLDAFVKNFNEPGGWRDTIKYWAGKIGDFINSIGSWVIENKELVLGIWAFAKAVPLIVGAFKLFGGIWDTIKWFKNGISLGKGFMSVAGGMGGGPGGGGGSGPSGGGAGGYGKNFRSNYKGLRAMGDTRLGAAKSAFKWGGGTKGLLKGIGGRALGLAGLGIDAYSSYQSNKEAGMSTGENVGKTATSTATKGLGAWGGAAAGAAIGALFGGVGAIPGAFIGGLLGGAAGYFAGDKVGEGVNSLWGNSEADDALFNSPVKDGLFTNSSFSKGLNKGFGKELKPKNRSTSKGNKYSRGILQGGKITPIDTRDDVLALKKGGALDKYSQPAVADATYVKHDFGNMSINGTIRIEGPGGQEIDKNILDNPGFKRHVTKVVQDEMIKRVNMGKMKG